MSAAAKSQDYLHTCAELHPVLVQQLSGRSERLDAVERAVAKVRSSRKLTPRGAKDSGRSTT